MALICVVSHHTSIAAVLADAEFCKIARWDGFLVELRLDQYTDLNLAEFERLLDELLPRAVVTFRHPAEGGKSAGVSDAERLKYLQRAADRGAAYIDIEARTERHGFRKGASQLILSYHDFETVPPAQELLARWQSMRDAGADVVKIAAFPKTMLDGARLLDVLELSRKERVPSVILGMGEFGFWTRVAGPLFGSPFGFARCENASGTAPGQPTWRELDGLFRFREIAPGWPVYGVIGNPIAHSLSPLLHNTAFRLTERDGLYLPFRVDGDPVAFVKAFERLGLRGLSVTIPHKEEIAKACAELEPLAKSVGAVNTLVKRPDGTWWGGNTDAFAAANALEQCVGTLKQKNVLILGAGGAARAIAFGVQSLGGNVFVANRTAQRAEALAREVGGTPVPIGKLSTGFKSSIRIDAVVNTTPVGMHPNVDATPLEKDNIPQGSVIFDTVYNPLRTKLLSLADSRGCKTLEGWVMFLGQGLRQFELWTGATPPREKLQEVLLAALRKRQSR